MTLSDPGGDNVTRSTVRPSLGGCWRHLGGSGRRMFAVLAMIAVAIAPVLFVVVQTADARRDIVYWDEFDTALAFVLELHEGATPAAFLQELFKINNEHRMVTSRLLFAVSYWLSGTIDFAVIARVGIATIVGLGVLLVASAGAPVRRLQLGLLLAFLMFQLEHYENFLWSGASIDHFQVVLLAAGAIVALVHGTRLALLAAALLAALATFTLAHGILVWPVGAVVLAQARRRRDLIVWAVVALAVAGGFLAGFSVNTAQSFASVSPDGGRKIVTYWLSILGAAPALGYRDVAPLLGGALLLMLAYAIGRGALRRERIALPLACFAVAAAGLIAIGRAENSLGHVSSRYYVLSALPWALGLFMVLNRHTHPRRPWRMLAGMLPPLVAFNLIANRQFADETDSWLNCRDIAAVNYQQYGEDGRGPFQLHPIPAHANALLRRAEEHGVYQFGAVCLPVPFPEDAAPSDQITYFVEEVSITSRSAAVRGWAAMAGRTAPRGHTRLMLRSEHATHVFTTVTVPRADVPVVMKQPGWTNAGFHFARRLDQMPAGDYQIGLLLLDQGKFHYVMTNHRLTVPDVTRPPLHPASP